MVVATVEDPQGRPRCQEAVGEGHRTAVRDQVGRLRCQEVDLGAQEDRTGVGTPEAVVHRLTSEATEGEGNL